MRNLLVVGLLAGAIAAPFAASAQFAKTEDAIKYRQSAFTLMGNHMGRLNAVIKGDKPFNAADVQHSAAVVEMMSKLPYEAFPAGSDANTKAKPEIWTEMAKFKELAEKLQGETAKLAAAAKTGDLAQVKTTFGAVGQACKACHDNYRAK